MWWGWGTLSIYMSCLWRHSDGTLVFLHWTVYPGRINIVFHKLGKKRILICELVLMPCIQEKGICCVELVRSLLVVSWVPCTGPMAYTVGHSFVSFILCLCISTHPFILLRSYSLPCLPVRQQAMQLNALGWRCYSLFDRIVFHSTF